MNISLFQNNQQLTQYETDMVGYVPFQATSQDFFNDFSPEVVNYFNNDVCTLRNFIANPAGIKNYMEAAEKGITMLGGGINTNEVGVMSILVVLNPFFIHKGDVKVLKKKRKTRITEKDSLYGVIPHEDNKPYFKIHDKYYSSQMFKNAAANYMRLNQAHLGDMYANAGPDDVSEFYTYEYSKSDEGENFKYHTITPQFTLKRFQVYSILCATRTYLNMMDRDDPMAAMHSAHIWFSSYAVDRGAGKSVTNIMDTNSIHPFNYDYLRYVEWLVEKRYSNKHYFKITPNITEQYVIAGQLQNKEVWGLCQSFALAFYTLCLRQPTLAMINMNGIFEHEVFRNLFFNLNHLVNSGKTMAKISESMQHFNEGIRAINSIMWTNTENYNYNRRIQKVASPRASPIRKKRATKLHKNVKLRSRRSKSPRRRRSRSKSPKRRRRSRSRSRRRRR